MGGRSTVPKMTLDETFESKEDIAREVLSEVAKSMEAYGYTLTKALVTDIDPDPRVKAAMNEINAAQRLREAAKDKAEAQKITIVKQVCRGIFIWKTLQALYRIASTLELKGHGSFQLRDFSERDCRTLSFCQMYPGLCAD